MMIYAMKMSFFKIVLEISSEMWYTIKDSNKIKGKDVYHG